MSPKTEKEKMLVGERYNCRDPELDRVRQIMKVKLRSYNQSLPEDDRRAMLEDIFGGIGDNVVIWPPFNCIYGENIFLGNTVFFNLNCMIIDGNLVKIGDNVMFGPGVQIYTSAHELSAELRNQGWEVAKPVNIGDSVWIGGSAILLPGVSIGEKSVVGAGSVVTKDVPANVIVAGNPARIIREIDQ